MKKKEEQFSTEDMAKAIYKSVVKALKIKNKDDKKDTDDIVRDIVDPNYVAQIDPDRLEQGKQKVLYKGKSAKLQEKGIKKLKNFVEKDCKKDESIPGLSQK